MNPSIYELYARRVLCGDLSQYAAVKSICVMFPAFSWETARSRLRRVMYKLSDGKSGLR